MFDRDIENSLKRERLDDSYDEVMNDENCETRTITQDGPFLTDTYYAQEDGTNGDGEEMEPGKLQMKSFYYSD